MTVAKVALNTPQILFSSGEPWIAYKQGGRYF